MLFGNDRGALRKVYVDAWEKYRRGAPVSPLEGLVAGVVAQHPEYHATLADPGALADGYTPPADQGNPFLHMSMHVAIREQIEADRPPGFRPLYRRLLAEFGDQHALEHAIMGCLAPALWQAQRVGGTPDEEAYLDCVRRLKPGAVPA